MSKVFQNPLPCALGQEGCTPPRSFARCREDCVVCWVTPRRTARLFTRRAAPLGSTHPTRKMSRNFPGKASYRLSSPRVTCKTCSQTCGHHPCRGAIRARLHPASAVQLGGAGSEGVVMPLAATEHVCLICFEPYLMHVASPSCTPCKQCVLYRQPNHITSSRLVLPVTEDFSAGHVWHTQSAQAVNRLYCR